MKTMHHNSYIQCPQHLGTIFSNDKLWLNICNFTFCCRSESPSQVFFILIQWLCSLVKTTSKVPEVTLAYDNMCNLDRMKVAQQPLPFPSPFDKLWLNVVKIIDVFHFRNHTSEKCHTKYNPTKIKADNPHFNTQAGEQTFVWVARFKHILCSMNKTHHLFYLHRMVVRRNWYTSKCYKNGKKPILPKKTSPMSF